MRLRRMYRFNRTRDVSGLVAIHQRQEISVGLKPMVLGSGVSEGETMTREKDLFDELLETLRRCEELAEQGNGAWWRDQKRTIQACRENIERAAKLYYDGLTLGK